MMKEVINRAKLGALGAALLGVVIAVPAQVAVAQSGSRDAKMDADIHKALDHKRFSGVQASVQNGVVVLTGTVDPRILTQIAARRPFHLVITNVPGPQFPLYAAGAQMTESYPVQPLLPGHALSIGVTSYDGGVYYGITADRDALPDIDVFGQCVREALDELVDSASDSRPRAPRGRKK